MAKVDAAPKTVSGYKTTLNQLLDKYVMWGIVEHEQPGNQRM